MQSMTYRDKKGKWIKVKVEGSQLYAETKQKEDEDFEVYFERSEKAILDYWREYVLKLEKY